MVTHHSLPIINQAFFTKKIKLALHNPAFPVEYNVMQIENYFYIIHKM